MGNPRMAPDDPFTRYALEGISPLHLYARGPAGPVSVVLDAFGAKQVSRRDIRMRKGERGMATPSAGSLFAFW